MMNKLTREMDCATLLNCKQEITKLIEVPVQNKPQIIIFDQSFSKNSVLWKDMHILFQQIKKHFFLIKSLAFDKANLIQTSDPLNYIETTRTDVCKVFQCILNSLQLMNQSSSSDKHFLNRTITNLINEIKHLLLYVGHIEKIKNIANITDCIYSSDYYYGFVHLCLELWLNSIKVLIAVNNVSVSEKSLHSFCKDLDQLDPYLQVINLFLIDYISITIRNYKSNSMWDSPFICKCFKYIFRTLANVFSTELTEDKYCFWAVYYNAVQNVQKSIISEKSAIDIPIDEFSLFNDPIECSQIAESCLWLTSHIAPLCTLKNSSGEQTISGYPVVKFLVHSLLIDSAERKEKNLRCALFHTWKTLSLWEPSSEVLLTLTDFYIKKIDETYSVSENGLQDLPYLFGDSLSWFKYIDNLSNTCVTVRNETSFYIYLRILYKQLVMDCSKGNLWRSLKGRVYSKFMPKKLIELSEVGLQNSFSLILTVATSGLTEAVDKISSLVSIFKTCSTKQQLISWKALFVLMLIYQKKGLNLNKITTKAVEFFNSKCNEYAAAKDNLNKLNLMNLLLVYINGMKEVFKCCDCLRLSEYELVASGFSLLLSSCGVFELSNILHLILEIFQKVQEIVSNMDFIDNSIVLTEHLTFLELSFKNIFPFLETISTTGTPPVVISDLAAIFTILSYKFDSSLHSQLSHSFSSIFMWFGSKVCVNSSVMSHYLFLILKDESLPTMLQRTVPNFSSLVFQSWLKLVIEPPLAPPANEELKEITFKVLFLKEFVEMFPDVQNIDFVLNPTDIAIRVFEIMGQTFSRNLDMESRHQLKLKASNYLQNFVSYAALKIKKHSDTSLNFVYKVVSHLVEHCSLLLHMHYSSDSILQQLFDKVILVYKIFPADKNTQFVLSNAINEFLPRILKGIFKLDFRKDKFVERTARHIIINHIFMNSSTNSSIKKVFIAAVDDREDSLKWDECEFLLDIMKDYILGSPENPSNGFELIFELFKHAPPCRKAFITNILLKCALEIYMKQNSSFSQYLWDLIRKILYDLKTYMDLKYPKKILIPILQWFIQEKIKWSTKRGFDVLVCVSNYFPEIVSDVVPFLTQTIGEMEKNRGLGEDGTLRNHLKNFITNLQGNLSNQHKINKRTSS